VSSLSSPLRPLPEAPEARRGLPLSTLRREPQNVIATVFRHEIRLAAGSLRLWAPALLLLVLMMLGALTSAARHRGEAAQQAEIEKAYARHLAGISIDGVAEILHPALKPPWRLALVIDGGQIATPDVSHQALSALVDPEFRKATGENPRLAGAAPLDWMLAIRIVLSIGAFLLCHGAVCGERQAGTLKLLFSFPIPRWKILTGKFLAAWTSLVVPFLAGALASLLLSAGAGDLRLDRETLARAALGVLLGLWAAAFFVLIALLVSSLTRSPSTSLGVLALLWVAAVVVVPALSVLVALRLQPLPTEAEITQRMAEARLQSERELPGQGGRWRQPGWATADGYAWERASAQVENRRAALQEEIRRDVLDRKLRQAALARTLASFSPPALMQETAERLLGTGLERDREFLEQAWSYRSSLEERVRRLDAADPESPHILYFQGYLSRRPLALRELPRFVFRERTPGEGWTAARSVLLAFVFETVLLAVATLLAFSRYDAG
jgi:ABC-type transport system involved in multi-copper enzyme maturation permease subunit